MPEGLGWEADLEDGVARHALHGTGSTGIPLATRSEEPVASGASHQRCTKTAGRPWLRGLNQVEDPDHAGGGLGAILGCRYWVPHPLPRRSPDTPSSWRFPLQSPVVRWPDARSGKLQG